MLTKLKQLLPEQMKNMDNFQLLEYLKTKELDTNCIAIIDYILQSGEKLKPEPEPSTLINRSNINLTSGFALLPAVSTTDDEDEDEELPVELPTESTIEVFGPGDGFGETNTEDPYEDRDFGGGRKRTRKIKKNKTKRTRKNRTKKPKSKKKRSRTKRNRTKRNRTKRSRTKRSRTKRIRR